MKKISKLLVVILSAVMVFSAASFAYAGGFDAQANNMLGNQYSGQDPWGGELSITIRSISDTSLSWSFTDVFGNSTLYNEMADSPIYNGHVDFYVEGQDLYNASITYNYSGTLDFVDNQIVVTFLAGEVDENSPEGGSSSRHVAALEPGRNVVVLKNNSAAPEGWVFTGGAWYYFIDHVMQTGWIYDGGAWYYLTESGAMATGWIYDGGAWYYLKESGAMATGWIYDGGVWYYLTSSGAMATGVVVIDGVEYVFDENGAWVA